MDSDKARVWRYSSFAVMLLRKVTSTPNSGENDSLMLNVETLNMELGTRLPVVASVMKPIIKKKKYFDLEVNFNVMIVDINKIIAESIKGVL